MWINKELTPSGKFLVLGFSALFYYFYLTAVLAEAVVFGIVLGAYLHNYLIGIGILLAGVCFSFFPVIRLLMHWTFFAFILLLAFYLIRHINSAQIVWVSLIIMLPAIFLLSINYGFFIRVPHLIAQNAKGTLLKQNQ
jgi:hypothetical protein